MSSPHPRTLLVRKPEGRKEKIGTCPISLETFFDDKMLNGARCIDTKLIRNTRHNTSKLSLKNFNLFSDLRIIYFL